MVRIRLRRVGAKKQPSYRVVAADSETPRDGRFLEVVGFYNPRTEPATIQLDEARIYDWLSKGAQPSDSVKNCSERSVLTTATSALRMAKRLKPWSPKPRKQKKSVPAAQKTAHR